MYLLCSTIVWGVQVLILIESEFPVWYPYYINWAIAILVEGILILISNLYSTSKDLFNIAAISLQVLRLVTLILLPCTFLRLRNRKEKYENDDEERQSLLRKKLAPKPGSDDSAESSNGYGSTDNGSDDQESERGEEDSYLKRQREAKEKIAKRLKNDGNWWTYAKGFSVSIEISCSYFLLPKYSDSSLLNNRFFFHTFGQFTANAYNFELSLSAERCSHLTHSIF